VKLTELINHSFAEGAHFDSFVTTNRLRTFCRINGWPEEVASQMFIRQEDGEYTISFPENLSAQVNFLEYGDQDTPPSAVLRNFLTNYIDTDAFATGISRSLKGMGVV
jgi:hypothetical protein